jgi:hypothetical protein
MTTKGCIMVKSILSCLRNLGLRNLKIVLAVPVVLLTIINLLINIVIGEK